MKKHLRETAQLTQSEFLSILGLLTIAAEHQRALKTIEQSLLNITLECDHDGKRYDVWGGGHVNDVMCESGDPLQTARDLLRKLDLEAPVFEPVL